MCYYYSNYPTTRLWIPGDIICEGDWLFQCATLLDGLNCISEYPQYTDDGTAAWPRYTQTVLTTPSPPPASLEVNCYDWTEVTTASVAYTFVFADKACDVNRVWFCENPALCQTTRPSEQTGDIWILTTDIPVKVSPTVEADCFNWVQGYNFLPGDLVCVGDNVWECEAQPLSDDCASSDPGFLTPPTGGLVSVVAVWRFTNYTPNPVSAPAMGDGIDCTEWSTYSKGSQTADPAFYKFINGEYACDSGRVFECVEVCTDTTTGSTNAYCY